MKMLQRKKGVILSTANGSFYDLPCSSSLNYFWNFGSLLSFFLMSQVLTGLFLTMNYIPDSFLSFLSVVDMEYYVNNGWLIRVFHVNGASFFLLFMFLHVSRGIFYESYGFLHVWMVGVTILLVSMGEAFLGYVLPWGQMSYWGATVITGLLSAIPYVGEDLMVWLWGGFCLSNATLGRFYTFHFLFPFVILLLSFIHLAYLHVNGSGNPMGVFLHLDKIPFYPYFFWKDLLGCLVVFFVFSYMSFYTPFLLMDAENFIPADMAVTPVHIQPEWYFLFAYAILRSIPNKLGGVLALALSITILYGVPFFMDIKVKGLFFFHMNRQLFWLFVTVFFLLMWIGANAVEHPYVVVGQILSVAYFFFFFLNSFLKSSSLLMLFETK